MRRAATAAVLAGLLAGCAAGGVAEAPSTPPSGSSTTDPAASPGPASPLQVPADGITLAQLGFADGPQDLSIPRVTSITTASDQKNTVTLVTGAPSAVQLAAYLRRALPTTGFTITGERVDGATATLTFAGDGWRGSFTGRGDVSGLTVMRASR
ncbi:MAG: hypothetical protein ACR2LI_10045 [Propionibacteriaceae bacterium]